MRAWRVHEHGDDHRAALRFETCPDPAAPDDGAGVDVAAPGINFAALLALASPSQLRSPLPAPPRLWAAGRVTCGRVLDYMPHSCHFPFARASFLSLGYSLWL